MKEHKWMHFSTDDFFTPFADLTENEASYGSVWEQPVFGFFRKLHERYGAVVSCYCFYQDAGLQSNLSRVTDRFAGEFTESADWLRFGFHGEDTDTAYGRNKFQPVKIHDSGLEAGNDYEKVIRELTRITGGGRCIDRVPRIHYYAGSREACQAWQEAKKGIRGLLSAEDDRLSYYLSEAQNGILQQQNRFREEVLGMEFVRTGLRLENVDEIEAWLTQYEAAQVQKMEAQKTEAQKTETSGLVIFTHDRYLLQKSIQEKFIRCGEFAETAGYTFAFPEDILCRKQ